MVTHHDTMVNPEPERDLGLPVRSLPRPVHKGSLPKPGVSSHLCVRLNNVWHLKDGITLHVLFQRSTGQSGGLGKSPEGWKFVCDDLQHGSERVNVSTLCFRRPCGGRLHTQQWATLAQTVSPGLENSCEVTKYLPVKWCHD